MLDKNDLTNLRDLIKVTVEEVFEEKLDEKLDQKLAPLHENIDKILKIVTDDRDELEITKGRVSNHEVRLSSHELACAN